MPSSSPHIPTQIARALNLIRSTRYGFDIARGAVDTPDLALDHARLSGLGGTVQVNQGEVSYHPHLGSSLQILQPSRQLLSELTYQIGQRYAFLPIYVEVTAEFITRDATEAQAVADQLLRLLHIPYLRRPVTNFHGTFYYNRRAAALQGAHSPQADDRRHPRTSRNCALYVTPSKLAGRHQGEPCAHIELRFYGAAALRRIGIGSIGDLRNFDHSACWHRQIRLFSLPSKTHLGSWVGSRDDVSGTMLRKRADRFIDTHRLDGRFVLQNALLQDRSLRKRLIPLPSETFFR